MLFEKNVICKGKEYIKGKIEGEICFRDGYAIRRKRENVPVIPIIFNNYKIGAESIINCDGLIIFEKCFNENIKEIIDRLKIPCVLISEKDALVEHVSILTGNGISVKEGEKIILDGKKVIKKE